MSNVVIITARGGNQSIPDKNIYQINGMESIGYPIKEALKAELVSEVFVSTECLKISAISDKYGAKVIERPASLSKLDTNHGDVIVHAADFVQQNHCSALNIVTILMGNMVMIKSEDIDRTIATLLKHSDADSCMTVWKAQDDHPYRAMKINKEGFLESFLTDFTPDTNRQSYPDVYYYNQGPWTFRYKYLVKNKENKEGPGPWWWMWKRSIPIVQDWVTGRDFHGPFDLWVSELYLREKPILD